MTPKEFIASISPAAIASMSVSRIPASFTIAEAALESGWGKSALAVQARNLFGVKADGNWTGDVLTMNTREYRHGQWVMEPAKWRKYPDWQGCMKDHAVFLTNGGRYTGRYADCFKCKDGVSFTLAVAKAGYATDPNYAKLITDIIKQHNLTQYDKG